MTEADVAALDAAVTCGRFANRSDALRQALARLLAEERQNEIDEAYRRGYGEHPQEDWIGAAGLAGLEAFDRTERGKPL